MARPPLEIRRARAEDLDQVLVLWARSREETTRALRLTAPADQLRSRLERALADGEVEVLLARHDERVIGFVMFRLVAPALLNEHRVLYLEQLYVLPELRRNGIARALLNGVVAHADRSGAEQVVSSVTPSARETHRFFARLGFAPVVVRRVVSTGTLRRRLAGEGRGAVEDLLSRRRTLRARARRALPDPASGLDDRLDDALAGFDRPAAEPPVVPPVRLDPPPVDLDPPVPAG